MVTDPEQTGDEVSQTLPAPAPAPDKEKEKENSGSQKPGRLFDAKRDLDLTSLDAPSIADQAEQAIVKALADLNPAGIVFLAARHRHWEPHEMPEPGSAFHKYYKSLNYFATYRRSELVEKAWAVRYERKHRHTAPSTTIGHKLNPHLPPWRQGASEYWGPSRGEVVPPRVAAATLSECEEESVKFYIEPEVDANLLW
ncbi:hypothetical protein B0T26DRAFT_673643 [Lasiosphaeria miniovina]|uniref:Uncharacterized protein n=1 Tax=Lasiosphaeria miniovina TaxID=1954250 RepID=A0AA40ATS1_9PEZI|nr:uncharacterized protein B0T26DRAFT_673643 [Lasiosphaeria miniovina]KAK0721870.1 hypothetical protein B0T26DRAFT_673643 [Lasiosphaeria miniovina]